MGKALAIKEAIKGRSKVRFRIESRKLFCTFTGIIQRQLAVSAIGQIQQFHSLTIGRFYATSSPQFLHFHTFTGTKA